MSKRIIGVMGPGEHASQEDLDNAYNLGKLIAEQNWILLTGGRNTGVMNAASKGAKESDGLTVGILPYENKTRCLNMLIFLFVRGWAVRVII